MGPLLFLIYINELSEAVKTNSNGDNDADVVIYADDNTPITADKDPNALQTKIQIEADLMTDWFRRNEMVCSGDKTKLLIVGTTLIYTIEFHVICFIYIRHLYIFPEFGFVY